MRRLPAFSRRCLRKRSGSCQSASDFVRLAGDISVDNSFQMPFFIFSWQLIELSSLNTRRFFVLAAGIIVQIAAPRIRRSKMQRKVQSRINIKTA